MTEPQKKNADNPLGLPDGVVLWVDTLLLIFIVPLVVCAVFFTFGLGLIPIYFWLNRSTNTSRSNAPPPSPILVAPSSTPAPPIHNPNPLKITASTIAPEPATNSQPTQVSLTPSAVSILDSATIFDRTSRVEGDLCGVYHIRNRWTGKLYSRHVSK